MKIGEVARRAGVTRKAVRHYESLGLIVPARLANGYRDFREYDVQLVREVRMLSQLGIPAERTRPFLECLAAGGERADDCPSSLVSYRDAIDELTVRIEALNARRTALIQRLREAAYRHSRAEPPRDADTPNNPHRLPTDLPMPADDGAVEQLLGRQMPQITLPSTTGGNVRLHALGGGRSVIYLYPLTGRPDMDLPEGWESIPGARGCTAEACDFRDHHHELVSSGASRVFGLSSQDTGYQREVVDRLRLPFAMLSDTGLRLAAALSLPIFEAGGATLYRRLTMVIHHSLIEHVFYPVLPPDRHAGQVVGWLRENAT